MFQLARTLWPRSSGDAGNRRMFEADGPMRAVLSAPVVLGPPPVPGQFSVSAGVIADDGALRVLHEIESRGAVAVVHRGVVARVRAASRQIVGASGGDVVHVQPPVANKHNVLAVVVGADEVIDGDAGPAAEHEVRPQHVTAGLRIILPAGDAAVAIGVLASLTQRDPSRVRTASPPTTSGRCMRRWSAPLPASTSG